MAVWYSSVNCFFLCLFCNLGIVYNVFGLLLAMLLFKCIVRVFFLFRLFLCVYLGVGSSAINVTLVLVLWFGRKVINWCFACGCFIFRMGLRRGADDLFCWIEVV